MKFRKYSFIVFSFLGISLFAIATNNTETLDTKFLFYTNSGTKSVLNIWNIEIGDSYYFSGKFINNEENNLELYIWFVDGILDSNWNYLWCKNEWDWTYVGNYLSIVSAANLSWNKITVPRKSSIDVQFSLNIPWWYSTTWNHVWCITHYVSNLSGDNDSLFTTLSRKANFLDLSVITHETNNNETDNNNSGGHNNNGGGWWVSLKKDFCPDWDFSDSYYDNDCGDVGRIHNAPWYDGNYSDEMNEAYQYCFSKWITTMYPIWLADMGWNLTRVAMAKMLSKYAINVLWIKPDTTKQIKFNDVSDKLNSDYNNWVTLAYQLWIMWINMPNNKFRPNDLVTRKEFVTAFSRMKYKTTDGKYENTENYYINHMKRLQDEWIITNTSPNMIEVRGYVMLILLRSSK